MYVADSIPENVASSSKIVLHKKGHRLPVTAAVASEDGKFLYSSGKEGNIIQWDLQTGRKLHTFFKSVDRKGKGREVAHEGHRDSVNALALSWDGKILASAGKDKQIAVWDTVSLKWVKSFTSHKDEVSVCNLALQPTLTISH